MTTTGARSVGTETSPRSPEDPPATNSDVGLRKKNEPRKNRLATARYETNSRVPRVRSTSTATPAPTSSASTATRTIWSSPNVRSRASPNAVAKAATTVTNTIVPKVSLTTMASVVAPMPMSGGTSAISRANHTIWPRL